MHSKPAVRSHCLTRFARLAVSWALAVLVLVGLTAQVRIVPDAIRGTFEALRNIVYVGAVPSAQAADGWWRLDEEALPHDEGTAEAPALVRIHLER